mmetsp:Transcript_4619/g.9749  ORF Transcript_4619/g.9749 Transcript_4619/m.9749 type:complete len:120 (-) Transcript_4619:173-532(-)
MRAHDTIVVSVHLTLWQSAPLALWTASAADFYLEPTNILPETAQRANPSTQDAPFSPITPQPPRFPLHHPRAQPDTDRLHLSPLSRRCPSIPSSSSDTRPSAGGAGEAEKSSVKGGQKG